MYTFFSIIISLPIIVLSSTIHEFAHAFAADKLGDLTPRTDGRLTINPLVHISPLGLISMVLARFGWSKPVRINEYNFQNPVLGTAITAIAGPASNFLVAVTFAGLFNILGLTYTSGVVSTIFLEVIIINLGLTVFNLLPIPPLDGFRIVRVILPSQVRHYWESIEKYSNYIILLFLLPITPIGSAIISLISSILTFLLKILVPDLYGL